MLRRVTNGCGEQQSCLVQLLACLQLVPELLRVAVCFGRWRFIPKEPRQPKRRWKWIRNLTWIQIPGVSWERTRAAPASSLLSPLGSI